VTEAYTLPAMQPGEVIVYEVDLRRQLEKLWEPERTYQLGEYRRPDPPNGFEYECTQAGDSGSHRPNWVAKSGEVVADGSAQWTARPASDQATDTISSASFSFDDNVTVVSESNSSTVATVKLTSTVVGSYTGELTVETVGGETIVVDLQISVEE